MKKAVIFDLDGLLIDSEIISYQMYCDLVGQYGHSLTIEEYVHGYSGKTAVKNMETLVNTYQLPISLEEGLAFTSIRESEYFKQGVALKEGAVTLLMYLKRKEYKILLASSSTRERAVGVLTQQGILQYFDDMVFGTEIKNGKPHPDIFLKASEKAKEIVENCLVLEDSEAGIEAAYRAGIDVLCIPDMKKPEISFRQKAAAVLDSLLEVIPWLEKENRKP